MTTYAKLRVDTLVLEPRLAAGVPNGVIFNDSVSGEITQKSTSGASSTVGSSDSSFRKQMQSGFVGSIASGTTVSKRSDGKIVPADSDGAGTQQPIGIAIDTFSALDSLGIVLLIGPNAVGAITGLGFTPGSDIFIGETTGGYVDDVTPFTGGNDSIIRIGIADCSAGAASAAAIDLILSSEPISRP